MGRDNNIFMIGEAIMAIDQTKFQKGVSVDGFDGRITKDREIK